jgi:hypothetical protein
VDCFGRQGGDEFAILALSESVDFAGRSSGSSIVAFADVLADIDMALPAAWARHRVC